MDDASSTPSQPSKASTPSPADLASASDASTLHGSWPTSVWLTYLTLWGLLIALLYPAFIHLTWPRLVDMDSSLPVLVMVIALFVGMIAAIAIFPAAVWLARAATARLFSSHFAQAAPPFKTALTVSLASATAFAAYMCLLATFITLV